MESAKDASLQNHPSAQSAPRVGSMMGAEAAVDDTPCGRAGQGELPKVGSPSGVTSDSETSPFSGLVRDSAHRQAEDKTESTSKPAHHGAPGKRSRRRRRRKNKTKQYDDPVNSSTLKRHSKTKAGRHRSRDGLATNKSRDDIRKLSHRNPSSKEGMGSPEDAANATDASINRRGSMEAPLDHIAMDAATPSGTTQKRSRKKRRKKHHKTARWEHLSETADRDDSKNRPNVVDKLTPGGSSSVSPAAEMKSSDSAVIKNQPDTVLQADKAHQAVYAEATSVEPLMPQADKSDASDDRQQQFKDLKEAAVVVSKLNRPLPTTGGPFGGLWSTRSSSPEQPSSRLHRTAEASAIDVKQKPPSLLPKQTSFSMIANGGEAHVELPEQPAAFPPAAQESERNVNALDHTGPFPAIAQAGTGRRVSIALPKWGGPFGLLPSSTDHSSEILPDKSSTAHTYDAKHEPPEESPLYMAPSSSAAVKKEEGTPLPVQAALSPSSVTKKVARHVLEETAFTVYSVESEEVACVQHIKASPTSTSSFESSECKSSRGSLAHSPHAKPEKDVRRPGRVRSMSLVLLEEATLLQSQPVVVTPTSPPPPPPEVVQFMPKLERPDPSQQAAIPPAAVAESGKSEKAAGKGKKKRFKKTKKKEVISAVTSPSTNGPDPDKPSPKSSEAQSASASRVNSVNEMNRRIEILRCQQVDFTARPGAHSPLRPVEFKHDHAVLTDKGEVKLCLNVSTCEEATMLWPFDHQAAVTKKEGT